MRGISAQAYLKAAEGVLVYQRKKDERHEVVISVRGDIQEIKPVDVFGVETHRILTAKWDEYAAKHPAATSGIQFQPPMANILPFRLDVIFSDFNRAGFDDILVPQIMDSNHEDLKALVNKIQLADEETDLGRLELYDLHFQVLWTIRAKDLSFGPVYTEDMPRKHFTEVAGSLDAYNGGIVCDTQAQKDLLRTLYPEGKMLVGGDGSVFVKNAKLDLRVIYGGQKSVPLGAMNNTSASPAAPDNQGYNGPDLEGHLVQLIVALFNKPHQKMTASEASVRDYAEENNLLGLGKIGKSALAGLGNVAGEGPLDEALRRVVAYLASKNTLTPEQQYRFAAGRIIRMQSAKRIYEVDGVYHIGNRN